jgi:hypothetical protein
MSNNKDERVCINYLEIRQCPVADSYENGNRTSGSVKTTKFLG